MKQRITALLVVLAMVSAVVISAVAEEPVQENGEDTTISVVETEENAQETAAAEKAAETVSEQNASETTENKEAAGNETPVTAPAADALQFDQLEELVKKTNLSYKSLNETISGMETMNDMAEDIREGIALLQSQIDQLTQLDPEGNASVIAGLEAEKAKLQQSLSGVSSMAQDTSQMEAGRKQLILGAQTMFIALVGMEQQEAALERQLAALDRTIEELNLRKDMGQISQLQLMEAESGRVSLVSGLTTLRMNISNYKMQLEQMIGKEMTGTTVLGAVPTVTEEELNALNLEENLKTALKNNCSMKAAAASRDKLDDIDSSSPQMGSAVSDMQRGADYSYKAAKQEAELKFRMLYAQLQDCRQVVKSAETALECEELACQAAELKYSQGAISENTLLAAKDELSAARDSLRTAKNDLFSTYNNYCWAVKHGVLN